MLYLCIPAYNEAETVGVLLWRIRKVFQDYSREYEVLVFDDGSTDATRDTLEPYTKVLPLTILGGPVKAGYAADLVLFDPATVADAVTFDDPRRPAVGIPYVFVNGELAMDDGRRTDALAGRTLRRLPDGAVV